VARPASSRRKAKEMFQWGRYFQPKLSDRVSSFRLSGNGPGLPYFAGKTTPMVRLGGRSAHEAIKKPVMMSGATT